MKYRHDSCHFRTTYGSRTRLSSSGMPVLHAYPGKDIPTHRKGVASKTFSTQPLSILLSDTLMLVRTFSEIRRAKPFSRPKLRHL